MLQTEHSAILSTFIKLPVVIKIFVLSIFQWPFYTGFTVLITYAQNADIASKVEDQTFNLSLHHTLCKRAVKILARLCG